MEEIKGEAEEKNIPQSVREEIEKELINSQKRKGQEIFIEVLPYWNRVAIVEDEKLTEILIDIPEGKREFVSGNIYKGIIADVVPSLQAVFINIGSERNSYLFVPSQSKTSEYQVGKDIIVQIKKESINSKGAKVTDNPTLPGKYIVLTLEKKTGVSKKIKSKFERMRLKRIVDNLANEIGREFGVVARTEAEGISEDLIREDFKRVYKVIKEIKEKAEREPAPLLLWSDSDIIRKAIRDYASMNLTKVYSNSKEGIERVKDLIAEFFPNLAETVELIYEDTPFLLEKYNIESEFSNILKDEIEVEGGVKLVFNETEAFTAIDVNTASFTGTENLDVTAYQANLIAAKEIIRQIRLRKLGGIIIADFIDIKSPQLKSKFIKEVKLLAEKDKERTKVFGITRLGLVEISRKKSGYSMKKLLMDECPTCKSGFVPSKTLELHRTLLKISKYQEKTVKVSPENFKIIDDMIKKLKINVRIQPKYGLSRWQIEV